MDVAFSRGNAAIGRAGCAVVVAVVSRVGLITIIEARDMAEQSCRRRKRKENNDQCSNRTMPNFGRTSHPLRVF